MLSLDATCVLVKILTNYAAPGMLHVGAAREQPTGLKFGTGGFFHMVDVTRPKSAASEVTGGHIIK